MTQLAKFINQHETTVIQENITVITDARGNLSIDVSPQMTEAAIDKVTLRIGVIDRLISKESHEIMDLIEKGVSLDQKIGSQTPGFRSDIYNKFTELINITKPFRK